MYHISENGIKLIKQFEGCSLKAYKNAGEKYYTIGYGHYGSDVYEGQTITQQDADDMLIRDIENDYAPYLDKYRSLGVLTFDLSQSQVDALISFAYNCGVGEGGLKTLLNGRNEKTVADKMLEYYHASSKIYEDGLKKRRKKERDLFLSGGDIIETSNTVNNHIIEQVKFLQNEINLQGFGQVVVDGKIGQETISHLPILRYGAKGNITKWLQLRLGIVSDGIFGEKTEKAVKKWQSRHGLDTDGVVGRMTWVSIIREFQGMIY